MHHELEEMAREQGRQCMGARDIPLACNAIVASWSRGSNVSRFLHHQILNIKKKTFSQYSNMNVFT